MTHVLLIDDDVELTAMLAEYLAQEGFTVSAVHTGEAGLDAAAKESCAIIVLDVMLPRMNGIEVLRRLRRDSRIPVLMLTARGDDIDRITGLDLGADDYVPKPFSPGELVARLRAILRRTRGDEKTEPMMIQAGPLTLWPSRRTAEWQGRPLDLTGTEFNILEVLARHQGRLLGKNDLSVKALGRPLVAYDRRIDVHISSIRQKLGNRSDGRSWIQTVRGVGYLLVCDQS